jgi:hypothetical protein
VIGIFRRLNATVPPPTDPGRYWPEPVIDPTPVTSPCELHDVMLTAKDRRIGQLELVVASLRGQVNAALRRAEGAEQALRELSVARAGDAAATELHHARRTLLQYEALLQGCRDKHGWNTTRSTPPAHPGAPA